MKYILFIIAVVGIKYSSSQTSLDLKEHLINGVEEFKSENYEEASMSFSEGNSLEGYEDIATYNRALSLLVSENFEDASKAFSQAIEMSDNPFIKSRSHYNTGNIELLKDQPDLEKAINSYKKALRIDPNLESARKNLALAYVAHM